MSKQIIDGIPVIVCDWVDEKGQPCDLGVAGDPKMFVDPDRGRVLEKHYQCGIHHGVIKQEDKPEFQLPENHKLSDTTLVQDGADPDQDTKIVLDGFEPDVEGKVWDGKK